MTSSTVPRTGKTPLYLGLFLGILGLLGAGCAAGAPPTQSGTDSDPATAAPRTAAAPSTATTNPTAAAVVPTATTAPDLPALPEAATATDTAGELAIGNEVGQRVPDFTVKLVDGQVVTAQQLIADGQPTFLFFFATW